MAHDFKVLQQIYQEGYRGQSFDPNPSGGYTPMNAGPGYSYSKGGLPGNTPGGGGENMYTPGANAGVPEVAEETPTIKKDKLTQWIDIELDKAKMFGMDYCVMVLTELRRKFKI